MFKYLIWLSIAAADVSYPTPLLVASWKQDWDENCKVYRRINCELIEGKERQRCFYCTKNKLCGYIIDFK
jgi:hypothetical protein